MRNGIVFYHSHGSEIHENNYSKMRGIYCSSSESWTLKNVESSLKLSKCKSFLTYYRNVRVAQVAVRYVCSPRLRSSSQLWSFIVCIFHYGVHYAVLSTTPCWLQFDNLSKFVMFFFTDSIYEFWILQQIGQYTPTQISRRKFPWTEILLMSKFGFKLWKRRIRLQLAREFLKFHEQAYRSRLLHPLRRKDEECKAFLTKKTYSEVTTLNWVNRSSKMWNTFDCRKVE